MARHGNRYKIFTLALDANEYLLTFFVSDWIGNVNGKTILGKENKFICHDLNNLVLSFKTILHARAYLYI